MQTIRSSREIDAVFRHGVRASTSLMTLVVTPAPPDHPDGRFCFIAGRRIGGAVRRNRMKRVLREAARAIGGPHAGLDVLVVAKAEVASAPREQIESAFRSALSKATRRLEET